jgi:hypothetical protein
MDRNQSRQVSVMWPIPPEVFESDRAADNRARKHSLAAIVTTKALLAQCERPALANGAPASTSNLMMF